MIDRRDNIIRRLVESGEQTAAFFRSLTPDEWDVMVYSEGRWRVREMLAHLSTIEGSMQWLFANIVEGGSGTPDDFDLDRFNQSQAVKTGGLDPEELIARFQAARARTVEMVRGMTDDDLDREGRHAYHGHGKLERFLHWAYEHAAIHEDEVRAALEQHRSHKP